MFSVPHKRYLYLKGIKSPCGNACSVGSCQGFLSCLCTKAQLLLAHKLNAPVFTLIIDLKHVKELKSGTYHSLVVAGFCEGFFYVVYVYCNEAKCLYLIEVSAVWSAIMLFFFF